MKRAMKYISFLSAALLMLALYSCSEESLIHEPPVEGEGTLLNLYIGDIAQPGTRLAELGNPGNITDGKSPTKGEDKKNIGLYIYYQDDYDAGTLTRPYVRNLECKVVDGKVVPVDNSEIYIYDQMTLVAFYPYNDEVGDYTFQSPKDEQKYFITEGDYSYQYYIPYRAQANVNPTTAYHVNLGLTPVHTTKIQVVLLTSNPALFPATTTQTNGVVKLVPDIDPQNAPDGEDKRENWVDIVEQNFRIPNPLSSGQYVQRFTSYVWRNDDPDAPHHRETPNHNDNTIKKGEILLQSDALTLFFPQDVDIREGRVYRYGYNIDTGEMFIPTSETLIYDATSLAAAGGGGYQVCDIDLTDVPDWTPVNLTGTYDGGGHAVKNMKIDQSPTESMNVGLFGSVTGNSLIKNLSLEYPVIEIDFSGADPDTETLRVGGLVGQLNRALTPEEIENIRNNLSLNIPPGLPQSVIDALIADAMKEFTVNTTSRIEGSKVSNPTITVKGENVIVGGLAGSVGDGEGYKGNIKDSYVSDGNISVNAGDEAEKQAYSNVQAGAFTGLLSNGTITNSYTTATAQAFVKKEEIGPPPVTTFEEVAKGFANIEAYDDPPSGITQEVTGGFTDNLKGDTESGVTQFDSGWPAWDTYGGDWPVSGSTLGTYWGNLGSSLPSYPSLVWETRLNVQK